MGTKKENNLDTKSSLVVADKVRIINSADSDDSESITYQNLITGLNSDLTFPTSAATSPHDPAGSYTVLDGDGYTHIIDSATGTITLPTLADNYNRIITIIRDVADSTTPLIIDGEGAETISGYASQYLYGKYAVMSLLASEDAGEWVYNGSPNDPYEISFEDTSNAAVGSPANGVYANPTGLSVTVLRGKWYGGYEAEPDFIYGTAASIQIQCSLSTSATAVSDISFVKEGYSAASITELFLTVGSNEILDISSDTVYYFIMRGYGTGTLSTARTRGTVSPTKIKFQRVF